MEEFPHIPPIDTEYKGYYFRSRLEARWAVFFEKMNWTWQYEVEGFELPSGRYLPDFYLPDLKCFVEVKPKKLNKKEFKLCTELSELMGNPDGHGNVLLLEGDIKCKSQRLLTAGYGIQDVVPIPYNYKYYPFFYVGGETNQFDTKYFDDTAKIIWYCQKARFEFEWREQ